MTFGRIAALREDGEDRSPVQKSEGWNGMLLPVNSFKAQMIDELTPIENEIIVNKTTDSVTSGTNYLTLLRFMGIENRCRDRHCYGSVRCFDDPGTC